MDRNERTHNQETALQEAMDGKQAEIWTALPALIESFDPVAMTVTAQPLVQGTLTDEFGKSKNVNLPLLADVPVVFPSGGGFTLTFPIKQGDECLVVFASRCIDGWWASGNIAKTLDDRMHDLSDGLCFVGIRSQKTVLEPAVDSENTQLRSDDGKAHVTMKPDYTITAENPTAQVSLTPQGEVTARADTKILLQAPTLEFQANAINMSGTGGGKANFTMVGDIDQEGEHQSTGDQVAGGISTMHHTHPGDSGGTTGEPH